MRPAWKRRVIKNLSRNKHNYQLFSDYDGDGKMELAFWNQTDWKLFLAEIQENTRKYKGEWRPVRVIYRYWMNGQMEQMGQEGYPSWKGINENEQEGLFACDID